MYIPCLTKSCWYSFNAVSSPCRTVAFAEGAVDAFGGACGAVVVVFCVVVSLAAVFTTAVPVSASLTVSPLNSTL